MQLARCKDGMLDKLTFLMRLAEWYTDVVAWDGTLALTGSFKDVLHEGELLYYDELINRLVDNESQLNTELFMHELSRELLNVTHIKIAEEMLTRVTCDLESDVYELRKEFSCIDIDK